MKLHHLEVHPAENGGVMIQHHFSEYGGKYKAPENHVFSEDEGHKALEHIAKHADISHGGIEEA